MACRISTPMPPAVCMPPTLNPNFMARGRAAGTNCAARHILPSRMRMRRHRAASPAQMTSLAASIAQSQQLVLNSEGEVSHIEDVEIDGLVRRCWGPRTADAPAGRAQDRQACTRDATGAGAGASARFVRVNNFELQNHENICCTHSLPRRKCRLTLQITCFISRPGGGLAPGGDQLLSPRIGTGGGRRRGRRDARLARA